MRRSKRFSVAIMVTLALAVVIDVAAAAASPYGFVAGSYPATLEGTPVNGGESTLSFGGSSTWCSADSFSTTQSKPSSSLTGIEGGKTSGQCGEAIFMHGCRFSFGADPAGEYFGGSAKLECPPGISVEIKKLLFGCDATLEPTQTSTGSADFTKFGEGLRIRAEVKGLVYHYTGGAGCELGSGSATWFPAFTLLAGHLGKGVALEYKEMPFGFFLNAGKFAAESYPRAISSKKVVEEEVVNTTTTHTFGAGQVVCSDSLFTGSLSGSTEQLTLNAAYTGCKPNVPAEGTATVAMNSCYYTLTAGGMFGTGCSKVGDKIEYKAYNKSGGLYCTVTVGAQSGLSGATLTNAGSGVDRVVTVNAKVEGVKWERTGSCGAASGSTGKITGEWTLSGVE